MGKEQELFDGVLETLLRKAKAYDSPEVIKAVEDFIRYCKSAPGKEQ